MVKDLILSEVNVKGVEYITDTSGIMVKSIKPNFKKLGPKYGKLMKKVSAFLKELSQENVSALENDGELKFSIENQEVIVEIDDVEVITEDIPGWLVANEGKLTVALDITITEDLKEEGIAREFVNRIQNIRKDSGLEVTDKINVIIQKHDFINTAINNHIKYISSQTLANSISLVDEMEHSEAKAVEIDNEIETFILIHKMN